MAVDVKTCHSSTPQGAEKWEYKDFTLEVLHILQYIVFGFDGCTCSVPHPTPTSINRFLAGLILMLCLCHVLSMHRYIDNIFAVCNGSKALLEEFMNRLNNKLVKFHKLLSEPNFIPQSNGER